MKKSIKNRIAAITAAMVMAVSTMAVNASAATQTIPNNYMSLTGVTGTNYGYPPSVEYATATATTTNKTTTIRYSDAIAYIYTSEGEKIGYGYNANSLRQNASVTSNKASAAKSSSSYAVLKGLMRETSYPASNGFSELQLRMYY